ncbi:hypothetical protein BDN70DRAFT_883484 [Pholiota conissans]|uniref:Uncharacterized protein n=1 Tax=Pholiota conissans TaxID=109636 RepID=A0A9P6CWX2_9AGAR|nr:hypothetical protein BDN70DRAFT_883484 [Pholiota conissans]
MALSATLFIDDQASLIQYLCPSLKQQVAGSFYNNTWTTVNHQDCEKGWFEYTFYGTGIQVAAYIASPDASYSVKIDDGAFEPQTRNGTYNSPTLSDGKHTLTYATGSLKTLPSFDYLTVTAGPSTQLAGQTLAVDDSATSIFYFGSWATSPPPSVAIDASNPLYANTAHWSSNIGDSLKFQFTGSSISVYGIVANVSSTQNITATYTIDGVSQVQSLPQGTLNSLPMVKLFHADVQPGDHTLFMNITDIQATRAIGVDFITYDASFNSISPANAASIHDGVGTNTALNLGAKVGLAIGVVAAAIFLAGLSIIFWRRRPLSKAENPKFPLPDNSAVNVAKPNQPALTW